MGTDELEEDLTIIVCELCGYEPDEPVNWRDEPYFEDCAARGGHFFEEVPYYA